MMARDCKSSSKKFKYLCEKVKLSQISNKMVKSCTVIYDLWCSNDFMIYLKIFKITKCKKRVYVSLRNNTN
jgi:hypothetical protein